jgi:hypothetical protein
VSAGQAITFGIMLYLTPSAIVLAVVLWKALPFRSLRLSLAGTAQN